MTALWTNDSLTFTFHMPFSNSIQLDNFCKKKFFDMILSLKSENMTVLWPKSGLTFASYEKFSNSISNWTSFVKEVFDPMLSLFMQHSQIAYQPHKLFWKKIFGFNA